MEEGPTPNYRVGLSPFMWSMLLSLRPMRDCTAWLLRSSRLGQGELCGAFRGRATVRMIFQDGRGA
jgi:hypothetical protein